MLSRILNSLIFRTKYFLKEFRSKKENRKRLKHIKRIREITNMDFSIISQNCWGGSIYEDLNIPYATPTVGLFFYAPCFNMFVNELSRCIDLPLCFTQKSKYEEANNYRGSNYAYPIGVIGDQIEIHFLHYKNEIEANEKWERRKQRIGKSFVYVRRNNTFSRIR